MENNRDWEPIISPDVSGWHTIIEPGTADCSVIYAFRLNLLKGEDFVLSSQTLELNAVIIKGSAGVTLAGEAAQLKRFDSFYMPGNHDAIIEATTGLIIYIGGAVCSGVGSPFMRSYDPALPHGNIKQIHGKGNHERDIYFTLNPEVPASRLLCGLTWSKAGAWTSWPPHKHDELEEVYCYFDMEPPTVGMHVQYQEPGSIQHASAHVVQSGSFMPISKGYHPTVAMPNTVNSYFWIMASKNLQDRRYDLAVIDPAFQDNISNENRS